MNISWPNGHKFAFTIFDDTDWATVDKVKPVYDFLADLGMRTTKSVWIFRGHGSPRNGGMTCEDTEYLKWVLSLRKKGFEIGSHNAAPSTSHREMTREALDRFVDLFGNQPICHANHVGCRENIYWGEARLSGWRRFIYNILTSGRRKNISKGHIERDPLFWGDLCQERVRYVRNFVFGDLNSLSVCPEMPYHDPAKPYVNFWYTGADGCDLRTFLRNFTLKKIDRLVANGGLCIAYAHLAGGFACNGKLASEFRERLKYVASKDGWFAPVSQVLDYIRMNGDRVDRKISSTDLSKLEARWITNRWSAQVSQMSSQD